MSHVNSSGGWIERRFPTQITCAQAFSRGNTICVAGGWTNPKCYITHIPNYSQKGDIHESTKITWTKLPSFQNVKGPYGHSLIGVSNSTNTEHILYCFSQNNPLLTFSLSQNQGNPFQLKPSSERWTSLKGKFSYGRGHRTAQVNGLIFITHETAFDVFSTMLSAPKKCLPFINFKLRIIP